MPPSGGIHTASTGTDCDRIAMAGENLLHAGEFGSPLLGVILKYLDGSQCESSSANCATLKHLEKVKNLRFLNYYLQYFLLVCCDVTDTGMQSLSLQCCPPSSKLHLCESSLRRIEGGFSS